MGFESPSTVLSQQDALAVALGVKFQAYNPDLAVNATAPASGNIFGVATYCTAGTVITGIKLRNGTAAAGTLPTTVRFGLADSTGKILAVSGNLNALANWVTGVIPFPIFTTGTTQLTLATSGIYYPCFIVNGTWSVTPPTPLNALAGASTAMAADGSNPVPLFVWTGQTDLPAVASSVTLSTGSRSFWMGVY